MANKLAVLDTSVVLLLLFDADPGDQRIERAENWLASLSERGYELVLPAPVITELSQHPTEKIMAALGAFRVVAYDLDCALQGAKIHGPALKNRAEGTARRVPKFDTLVAAVAHQIGAQYLLHVNRNDFKRLLESVMSTTKDVSIDIAPLAFPIQDVVPGTQEKSEKPAPIFGRVVDLDD